MKKILIATACAFTLCLTSCASKAAPETKTETQPPQTEIDKPSEEENQTENESDENQAEDSDEDAASAEEETSEDLPLSSEDFPEPEVIEEPEIITLEPVEEPAPEEKEEASEEVKEEEPPVIVEENKQEEKTEDQTSEASENQQNENEAGEAEGQSDSDDDGITVIGGGIDITDEDTADEKYSEKAEDITPSRSVTLKKFEYLDVTYPGTGWIYMGLIDNSKDIAYFGRKLGTKDTKFSLQARNAGKKIVHFYRNDPLTGNYLDDYLEIIILSENGSNKTHIAAPEYKLPVQKKETKKAAVKEEKVEETDSAEKADVAQTAASTKTSAAASTTSATSTTSTKSTSTTTSATTNAKPAASTTTTATTTAATTTSDTSETYTESTEEAQTMIATTTAADSATLLKEAQLLYNEKEYSAALNKLNLFFEYSTDNRDEALYLKGQILEAKSDVRDIKGAIDAYTTLTKNYPASKLWDSANKRIIYLKRFYLEVRQIL